MDTDLIIHLASEFRYALEKVSNKGKYGELTIFAKFPDGCCTYTSDLLAEYLIDNGIQRERIQILNSESTRNGYTHCWLMIDNIFYLDITADQFNNKPYFKKYSPIPNCCFVPKDTHFFELFINKNLNHSNKVGIGTYSGDNSKKLRVIYIAALEQIKSGD